MKKITVVLAMAAVSGLLLAGCVTTPLSMTQSNTPVHDKVIEENLGKTRGTSSAYSILGLWMLGRPDTGKAVDAALTQKGGDALINLYLYETTVWYVFFSVTTVTVEGEAVKFSKAGVKDEKTRK